MQKRTKSAKLNLRVTPELKAAGKRAAAADHRSLTSLVEKLLDEHVRRLGYLGEETDGTDHSNAA